MLLRFFFRKLKTKMIANKKNGWAQLLSKMSGCNYGVSGCNQNSTVTSIFWLRATAGTDTTEKTSGIKHYIYMCIYIYIYITYMHNRNVTN